MPEGPELHLAGRYVNQVCANRTFIGKVVKSEVSLKNPDIPWDAESYRISARSRGKEVKLTLSEITDETKKSKTKLSKLLSIVFRFGMSGKFKFQPLDDYKVEKHAHLNFFSEDNMVLSFVDYRRFGRWEVTSDWGTGRGPCVIQEPDLFRIHVLNCLEAAAFKKPICEVLLDQKYFNGIGNYLRAEILYRLRIPPFTEAKSVLQPLKSSTKIKREHPDILDLCHQLPEEVVNLSGGKGYIHSPEDPDGHNSFWEWLQCYYKPGMQNMVDHNQRTIWFDGPPGNMVPKNMKTRGRKVIGATKKRKVTENDTTEESEEEPKKKQSINTRGKVEKSKGQETVAGNRRGTRSNRRKSVKSEEEKEISIPDEKKKPTRKESKDTKITSAKTVTKRTVKKRQPRAKINGNDETDSAENGLKAKKDKTVPKTEVKKTARKKPKRISDKL